MYYTNYFKLLSLLIVCTCTHQVIARSRSRARSCPAPAPRSSVASVPQASLSYPQVKPKTAPRTTRSASSNVVELRSSQDHDTTQAELNNIIQQNSNTMIYFYGTHCEPCHWMRPYLDKVMPEYPHIKFVIINVDEHPMIRLKYNIKGWPSLVPFKNSKQIIPVKDPKKGNELYNYLGGPRDEQEIRTVLDMIYSK